LKKKICSKLKYWFFFSDFGKAQRKKKGRKKNKIARIGINPARRDFRPEDYFYNHATFQNHYGHRVPTVSPPHVFSTAFSPTTRAPKQFFESSESPPEFLPTTPKPVPLFRSSPFVTTPPPDFLRQVSSTATLGPPPFVSSAPAFQFSTTQRPFIPSVTARPQQQQQHLQVKISSTFNEQLFSQYSFTEKNRKTNFKSRKAAYNFFVQKSVLKLSLGKCFNVKAVFDFVLLQITNTSLT